MNLAMRKYTKRGGQKSQRSQTWRRVITVAIIAMFYKLFTVLLFFRMFGGWAGAGKLHVPGVFIHYKTGAWNISRRGFCDWLASTFRVLRDIRVLAASCASLWPFWGNFLILQHWFLWNDSREAGQKQRPSNSVGDGNTDRNGIRCISLMQSLSTSLRRDS